MSDFVTYVKIGMKPEYLPVARRVHPFDSWISEFGYVHEGDRVYIEVPLSLYNSFAGRMSEIMSEIKRKSEQLLSFAQQLSEVVHVKAVSEALSDIPEVAP